MGLLTKASVAVDGSKFKAVNNRDRNFTRAKVERRRAQLEESVARYLSQLDTIDLQEPSEELGIKTEHLKEKLRQPVVVGNKPGGSGVVALQETVRARPDGHTMLIGASSTAAAGPDCPARRASRRAAPAGAPSAAGRRPGRCRRRQ